MGRQYGYERFRAGKFADVLHCCVIITVMYEFCHDSMPGHKMMRQNLIMAIDR